MATQARTRGRRGAQPPLGPRVAPHPWAAPDEPALAFRAAPPGACPRRSQPAAPRGDSGALFARTPRAAQRPRGLARPRRDLHALQSQRFKVRSAGRPSPARPRRYSSPRRREFLAARARAAPAREWRAPPPSEALCVSARPAGPARDVPARPAAPPRQRPSPMLISLAARLSPPRSLPGAP